MRLRTASLIVTLFMSSVIGVRGQAEPATPSRLNRPLSPVSQLSRSSSSTQQARLSAPPTSPMRLPPTSCCLKIYRVIAFCKVCR